MTGAIGVDIGGTKVRLVDDRGTDVTVSSEPWELFRPRRSVAWLARWIGEQVDVRQNARMVVGAHGAESDADCAMLTVLLGEALPGLAVRVLNDAELLVPAAGHEHGIALVAGTGSVALGRAVDGTLVRSGGWGWVLSDDGSGSALVRDAARLLLAEQDAAALAADEPLAAHLLASVEVVDLGELAVRLSWDGGVDSWGRHAPAVFSALDEGSVLARKVCRDGARSLAAAVVQVATRGAIGDAVVMAGGVLTARPDYAGLVAELIVEQAPGLLPETLHHAPVLGALHLARGSALPA